VGCPALFSDWLKTCVHRFIIMKWQHKYTENRAFLDDERILYCAEVCDLK
jgi:hypothetical protein